MASDKTGVANVMIHKLTPRLIAFILITVILLLTLVIIFAVYQGSEVNFFGIKIKPRSPDMPQQIPSHIMSADQFIATLPYQFRDTPKNTRQKIEDEMRRSDDKSERIHELEIRMNGLEKALTDTTTKLHSTIQEKNALQNALDRSKDKFFNHIMRLEEEMTKWDGSINTKIRVQEKTDVFRLIQEVLTRIRYYQGEIDADPARAREALRTYKIAKGFKDEELWDTITKETIISIVRDYADTLLKESRG